MEKNKINLTDYFSDSELDAFREYMSDYQIIVLLIYFNEDPLACTVWFQKYAYKKKKEIHPDETILRLAAEFYRIENDYITNEWDMIIKKGKKEISKEFKDKLSSYGYERMSVDEADIYAYMADFKYIIPQGSVLSQLGTESMGSLSNCFVVESPYDSYSGILLTDEHLAQIMKRRGGVGVDISTLRPKGAPTSNVAKSSTGAVSFMERFSNTTREVAQGGRRGALMLSIGIEHPDVEDFIEIKQDLSKVTGANISVRVNDQFMEAVVEDKEYCLRWPSSKTPVRTPNMKVGTMYPHNGGFIKWIKAKDLWKKLISSAHKSAEPGILFWSKVLTHSPDAVYSQYRAKSTNPCGEIPIPANDSCRLIAVNLLSFVKKAFSNKAEFDFKTFYNVIYEGMRFSDNLVTLEIEAVSKIINKIKSDPEPEDIKGREITLWENIKKVGEEGRRTGLGFTALGDTAAALDLQYGGEAFREFFTELMKTKLMAELDCTIDMAIIRGPFKGWDVESEFINIDGKVFGMNSFFNMLITEFPEQAKRMAKYGRRNVSWSTVAPTGSLSMLAQVTSGIEPLFLPFYKRRKKILEDDNTIPDFIDAQGDKWSEHVVLHETFKEWCIIEEYPYNTEEEIKNAFEKSPWYGSTAKDIDWESRVKVQGIAQKYTTHSISSTVNLPNNVTVEEVDNIYMSAWKEGLKGITVYRDGSRDGVLISDSTLSTDKFKYQNSIKRPKVVKGIAKTTVSSGDKFSIFIGLMDGIPYEVFAYKGGTKEGTGEIIKIAKGDYQFIGEGQDSRHRIITGKMTDEQEIITRLISGSLRHGRDIRFIVEDLQKTSGNMFSFNSAIARVLKTFIPKGTKTNETCPECGASLVFEEGCMTCKSCGYSKCG